MGARADWRVDRGKRSHSTPIHSRGIRPDRDRRRFDRDCRPGDSTGQQITDRKKPGVAFWATVALVAVLAYPLSLGPACWLARRKVIPNSVITKGYMPVIGIYYYGPKSLSRAVGWYAGFVPGRYTTLEMAIEDDARIW